MVQKESLEIDERGEIRKRAEERVVLEAEDSELVEAAEGGSGDGAAEAEALNGEAHDAALSALDAAPLAEVEALVGRVEELVVQVSIGLEGEQRDAIGRERGQRVGGGAADGGSREAEKE